jgi:hypothetical protein
MSNRFLNATEYANVMLLLAKNQLVTGRLVQGRFKDEVTDENGLSINIKRPPRFAENDAAAFNATLDLSQIVTGSVNVRVNQYAKVHVSVGDIEYVQSYNELMRSETMKSAASRLAHQIDKYLQSKTFKFFSHIGGSTPATDPDNAIQSPAAFNRVHTRLMDMGVPNSDLCSTVLFNDGELIRGSLIGGNIQGTNRTALERTRIPLLSEIDVYATQQCPSLTVGTRVASAASQVDGAAQNVNYRTVADSMTQNLVLKAVGAAATVKVGEVFTINGVFAYDWRNQQPLPYLQQFTVVGDSTGELAPGTTLTASGGGALTVKIYPAIIVQGSSDGTDTKTNTAFGTVTAAPADSAPVTWLAAAGTTYRVRSAFHKSAIQLVSARLQMPFTGEASYATDPETGISIRYWRGSDIATGAHIHRWDCIYGATNVDPFMGSRISGTAA